MGACVAKVGRWGLAFPGSMGILNPGNFGIHFSLQGLFICSLRWQPPYESLKVWVFDDKVSDFLQVGPVLP